jgi:lipopolysaccharide export system protein LptC
MTAPVAQRAVRASEWLWTVLPVVVMGLLAAWSFWLVRSTPTDRGPSATLVQSTRPDIVLKDFVLHSYDASGGLTSELRGAHGWHHPSDESMLVDQARLRALGRGGAAQDQWITAESNRLWVSGDQTQYKLTGNAKVSKPSVQDPAQMLTFQGDELFIDDAAQWVSSTEPVTIDKGTQTMQADAMRYDQAQGILNLSGNVRVTRDGRQPVATP